jgi:hypothetical protein
MCLFGQKVKNLFMSYYEKIRTTLCVEVLQSEIIEIPQPDLYGPEPS